MSVSHADEDHQIREPVGVSHPEPTPFDRFESLAKRLLRVSKDDVREAEAGDQGKRRTA